MFEPTVRRAVWPALALIVLLAWGCGPGTGESVSEEDLAEPAVEADASSRQDVEAKLALADEFDGAADGVVSRCPGCGLAMEGSEEYAVRLAGYEIRFCSAGCKKTFEADPEAAILALALPVTPPADPPAAGDEPGH